ncbi:EAL domain-containing protein [Noviherbaspirillum sp.]|uniref:EAL domain-containing protein n=1 Tax=Noviherbaspirillum sp. TaxID=1926288 RepID=UPI002D47C349|nr:EAL domain-containing protein [Noviherbaspirillum sp.]HZW21451.1 EAL domain-containing protein [Noviherbaspirillum sp.]
MHEPLKLLVIEDSTPDFLLTKMHLEDSGIRTLCQQVDTLDLLRRHLCDSSWNAILSDFRLPGMDFEDNLHEIRAALPDTPVILVSGTLGEEKAIELLKLGVTDFVLKDNLARLVPSITRALRDVDELRAKRAAELALRERDKLLQEMSALAHVGGWEFYPPTGEFSCTAEVARICDLPPSEKVSLGKLLCFLSPDSRRQLELVLDDAVRSMTRFDLELELLTEKGNHKWIRMVGDPVTEDQAVTKLRGALQDITDRKRDEIALFEQKERAEVTLHSIGDAVITTDEAGNIDYLNPIAEALTGWPEDEAVGKTLMDVLNIVDESKRLPLPNPVVPVLSEGKATHLPLDCMLLRRGGTILAIEDSAAPIRGRDGGIIGAVLVFRDVTASREITAQVAYQATHDLLTGLPNRILAWDRLDHAISIAQRDAGRVGVLHLNLDRFKYVNDSLGHAAGDEILKEVARRLKSVTRAMDTSCRHGGDDFMVIMPGTKRKVYFDMIAQKVMETVSAPFFVGEREVRLTFSIGVSIYPHDGSDSETLFRNAGAAMRHAKSEGRNNLRFYSPEMINKASERLSLEVQLRHAITNQEFEVYYQPKVGAAHGKIVGAEALIRWNHPQAGMLGPGHFIDVAEDSGLIVPIGQWIYEAVCRQNQQWLQRGLACVPISVNLSAIQLRHKALVDTLRAVLEETGLPPELLELELTESLIMHGTEAVIGMLHKLKDLGLTLSIDDFGTGYSSLSYLKRFPVDRLKIDQAFVRDVVKNESDAAIVRAIISMAHSLKLAVIAEGVETAEQYAFLKNNDCDEIQGYYFSGPIPAMSFERMLNSQQPLH